MCEDRRRFSLEFHAADFEMDGYLNERRGAFYDFQPLPAHFMALREIRYYFVGAGEREDLNWMWYLLVCSFLSDEGGTAAVAAIAMIQSSTWLFENII